MRIVSGAGATKIITAVRFPGYLANGKETMFPANTPQSITCKNTCMAMKINQSSKSGKFSDEPGRKVHEPPKNFVVFVRAAWIVSPFLPDQSNGWRV